MRRYLETLFLHKRLFFVPLLAVTLIALLTTIYAGKQYKVSASIWVEPSPLLDPIEKSRGTPSELASQSLRERIATESFRKQVMDQAGLTEVIQKGQWPVPSRLAQQIESVPMARLPVVRTLLKVVGVYPPLTLEKATKAGMDMMETTLAVAADGTNLMRVNYVGKEPDIGKRLIEETLALYKKQTLDLQEEQAKSGIGFYTGQLNSQLQRVSAASSTLQQFLEGHPAPIPPQTRPPAEQTQLDNLQKSLVLEQMLYQSTSQKLEDVRLTGEAAVSNRDQSFRVTDPPDKAEPVGTTTGRLVITLMLGLTLGAIVGFLPIIMLTWLDKTLRTRDDIEKAVKTPLIAQVPLVRTGGLQRPESVRAAAAKLVLPQDPGNR